ncbi:hypothetical protein LLE49_27965 [Alicyclobacillus tolerans]|uniref:hypothetical protein n=1 Tax=Alicyclobacillus tolerans TaxID=90970 RepID=UPI001F3CFEAF|nr:hypothetical protein [Alicyclobacillus tolerans]MCF8568560.1 hypothetical protein [Alicyclobacillus tolerans]
MFKFARIWMALLTGELMLDLTVNTEKFPFHALWDGERTKVRLDSRRLENGTICRNLWTEKGTIPYHLSFRKLFKIIALLALKGSVKNFYGGIFLKLAPTTKINIANAAFRRFGYVTLTVKEYKTLRSVMEMLKDKSGQLKQQVASHEELLAQFSVQHRNLTDEVQDVRGRLDQTQEKLGQTRDQLSNTQEELGQTQQKVAKLEAQTDALCAALGIQSVDEFLQSVLPKEPDSADDHAQQTKLPGLE